MKILFNTKVRNVFRVICMEESDLDKPQIFWEQVVKQHKIIAEEEIELQLLNSMRAPIEYSHVPILINQHKHDPNFYIEIRIDGPGIYVEQTENLENYLRDNQCESILLEEKRNNLIDEESLELLLNRLRDFLYKEYSLNPTAEDLEEVCQAAIKLFPSLTSDTDQKIDILYDRAKRSGRLYEKVRYKQRKRQDKEKNVASVVPNSISENNDQTIDELIAFFDSCVLPRDKSKLLEKMESSAEMRLASNGNNREMFDKGFHLYRLDSDLVFADFKFMFKNTDHDALFKIWSKIEKKPFEKFQIKLDRLVDAYHRDEVSHSMLTFVKLFSTHKYKFERSVESLIVFCDNPKADPQDLINKKSVYPHIICIYSKTNKTSQYYLVVSKSLMNVPDDHSFLQVMDIFFKIHFIFCVPFEPSLVQFMTVFEKYVYGITGDNNLSPANKNRAKTVFSNL